MRTHAQGLPVDLCGWDRRWTSPRRHRPTRGRASTFWGGGAVSRLLAVVLVSTLFGVSLAAPAEAQIGGLHVSPARLEGVIASDGSVPPLVVHNRTPHVLQLHLYAGWGSHDRDGRPLYRSTPSEPGSEVAVTPNRLHLLPDEKASIFVRVDPPGRPHYPVLFIEWSPLGHNASAVRARVAVPLLLVPEDGPAPELRLIDVEWTRRPTGEFEATLVWQNEGAAHGRTSGTLRVRQTTEPTWIEMPVPEALVLPGAERAVRIESPPEGLPPGLYTVEWIGVGSERVPLGLWRFDDVRSERIWPLRGGVAILSGNDSQGRYVFCRSCVWVWSDWAVWGADTQRRIDALRALD